MAKKRASTSVRKSKKAAKQPVKKAIKKTAKKKTARKAKRKVTRTKSAPIKKRSRQIEAAMIPLSLADPTIVNLNKIDHIVVLMMENRSFDHILGYLKLELGKTVDGLTSGMSNTFNGTIIAVHRLTDTAFPDGRDPCHTGACVAEQLSGANGGFVSNFAHTFPTESDPGLVMGYYNDAALPVYDLLAKRFGICDRWFCSVDGSTWPNRLYSLAGRADGSKDNKTIPLYNLPTFVRHLESRSVSWNWYAFDVSTLRLVDPHFRIGMFDHFRWVKHPTKPSFLRDAAAGDLPSVSWIDPNFSASQPPNHLGSLLAETTPTPTVDLDHLVSLVTAWKTMEFQQSFARSAQLRARPGKPNELQSGLAKARKKLIQEGHPEGHP